MENSCTSWDAPQDFDSGVKPINIWGILTGAGFFPSTVTNWVLKSTKTNTQSFPKGCFAKNLVVFNVVLFSRSCFDSFPMSNKLTSRMLDHTVVGLGLGCPSSCIQNELLNTSDMQWRVVKAKGQRSQIPLLWYMSHEGWKIHSAFILKQLHNKHGWPAKKIFGGPQAMIVGAARQPKCNCSLKGPGLIEPAWARKD